MVAEQDGPVRPEPKPVALDPKTTAVVALDLSRRCHDQDRPCFKLMPALAEFLERARASGTPVVFTVSLMDKGTSLGGVASPLKHQPTEPLLFPDSYDKFWGGELSEFLNKSGSQSLVIVGSLTNVAVLYTATTAARVFHYQVVVPLDGVNARTEYEQEYALHQLSVLPGATPIQFTALPMVTFE